MKEHWYNYIKNKLLCIVDSTEEQYICTEDYFPSNSDEVTLDKGTVVEVIQKNLDGWWWVR